jgi:ATP-dependent DNA helicase RecQ
MITLTARGNDVMKGATDYHLHWPPRSRGTAERARRKLSAKEKAEDDLLPVDEGIFERLKELRLDLARENGNVPAYLIFPDETLRAFARLKPGSIEAGRKIRGVGEVKAKRYLPVFIEAIRSAGRAPS